jgi:CheY-like chemotaxis protein
MQPERAVVLIVDDDPLSRRATARVLKGAFEVLTADSHDTAVVALELRQDIRAVISDCQMGEGPSGIDLLKRVQTAFPTVARVTLSGSCDGPTRERLVSSGVAHAALPKPFDPRELLAVLGQRCGMPMLAPLLAAAGSEAACSEHPTRVEQRASPRRRISSMVWYRPIGDAGSAPRPAGLGRSLDLSETGVGLMLTRPLPVREKFLLEISKPARPRAQLRAVVEVRHSSEAAGGFYRVGMRILAIPPGDELTLRRLLAGHP